MACILYWKVRIVELHIQACINCHFHVLSIMMGVSIINGIECDPGLRIGLHQLYSKICLN